MLSCGVSLRSGSSAIAPLASRFSAVLISSLSTMEVAFDYPVMVVGLLFIWTQVYLCFLVVVLFGCRCTDMMIVGPSLTSRLSGWNSSVFQQRETGILMFFGGVSLWLISNGGGRPLPSDDRRSAVIVRSNLVAVARM